MRFIGFLLFLLFVIGCSPAPPLESTATDNVQVLSEPMLIPGLQRQRTIRLYLPPDYSNSEKRYPVVYMHDAQNLFDQATSYAGEWQVDETLNRLAQQGKLELIVVGIDNGGEKRMNELSPWPNAQFGDAEGEQYVDFIVHQLKPFIDSNYRTQAEKEATAIMGSSMGGLISHYAILHYPDVFSKAGIFSPSYWFSTDAFTYTKQKQLSEQNKLFFLMGEKEGAEMVSGMRSMVALIEAKEPNIDLTAKFVADAEHNEAFWAAHFEQAILWLYQ